MRAGLIAGTTAALLLGAAAVWWSTSTKSVAPPAEVRLVHADQGSVQASVRATGVVRSARTIQISAEVAGTVVEAKPQVGDVVQRGALLLRLASDAADAEIQLHRLSLDEAQRSIRQQDRQLEALRQDFEAGGESRNAVREAENRLQLERSRQARAMAEFEAARRRRLQYVVNSPITGTVTERKVNAGEWVQAGTTVFTLATTQALEALVKVDPSDTRAIRIGMTVLLSTEGSHDKPTEERVLRIEPGVRREGGADFLPVWISASNPSGQLVPNQQVDVRFTTVSREVALRLPLEALVTRGGRDQVWIVRDGRLALVPVAVGTLGDHQVEILSGLRAEQAVALLEGKPLNEGDAVRPLQAAPRKAPAP